MTLHLNLTQDLEQYVARKVETGRYASPDDFIMARLRSLKEHEEEREAKMIAFKAAIQEGMESGIAEGDIFAQLSQELDLPEIDG